jgi:hypothetical protein
MGLPTATLKDILATASPAQREELSKFLSAPSPTLKKGVGSTKKTNIPSASQLLAQECKLLKVIAPRGNKPKPTRLAVVR